MEQKIRLNMIPTGPVPVCHASQYDKKREIGLVLFDGNRPLLLTDETLELDVRKSDSHIVTIDVPTPEGTNLAVFETTEQMCAVAGSNECELRIRKAGADIGSLNFIMEIERSPMENGLQSDSEIRNLATQMTAIAQPLLNNLVPPMVEEIVPQVIGDDYYTAEQTDEAIEAATEGKADTTYVNTELNAKMDKTNPTGTGAFSLNRKANTSIGTNSFAEGENATASGYGSHSEGTGTTASGNYSHAENNATIASGNNSHAEGVHTTASGSGSHAEGYYTIANHKGQHAFGEYNMPDSSTAGASARGNYIEVVGNGIDADHKSNARTLDWEGNETLAGDLNFNGSTSLTAEIRRLDDKIDDKPDPMVYKGTLGTGGTIETLPAADASREGYTYKVITAGTYAGHEAKVGDTFTCCKPEGAPAFIWDFFSRGDTDTDTWRSIKVNGTEVIGSGISSGPVDFIGSENIEMEYESTGNKIKAKTKNLYTKAEVDDLIEDAIYDILPSDTESGPIANFETDLALPLKSMEIEVKAQQEAGTPTPSDPKAISGWSEVNVVKSGANLWNEQWEKGGYYSSNGQPYVSLDRIRSKNYIPVEGGSSIYFFMGSGALLSLCAYDSTHAFISDIGYNKHNQTINIPNNARYVRFTLSISYGTTYLNDVSVNYPSTDHDYHAYNGTTEVIELGGTYYGGRLLQDKDGHRRFEVTCVKEHISLSGRSYTSPSGYDRYSIPLSNQSTAGNKSTNKKCSVLNRYAYSDSGDYGEHYYIYQNSAVVFFTENTFRTGEFDIVYPLGTPYTIDLPDGEPITTLIGTNNIYADSGDTAVEFKESINQKIASLQALLLST